MQRVSSSQNERTLGGGGSKTNNGEGVKLGNLQEMYFLNLPPGFRSQKLSECYNSLISGDDKLVPDKFHPKINKTTPRFKKQLKQDDAIDNAVCEIKLLQATYKDFHLKIKETYKSVLNKIKKLDKDNNIK